ncbi:hypothetical protein L5F50_11655, partial [Aliarcobacter butzleri]|nr:hypothetical protein [Aliarcobacter butzleri]
PDSVYKNQRFEVTVKALITTDNFTNLTTTFSNSSNIELLNENNPWKKISNDTYENSYFFKVKNGNFKLPNIEVNLWNQNLLVDSSQLSPSLIRYSEIGKSDERFSNIIADNIILKAYKTKQYNNNSALTIIDIDAINSNLEDFKLKNVEEQGLSNLKEWEDIQNLVYYFVTPIYQKNLTFTYYNTKTNSFKDVKVPLVLQNELVSTQTDLNPNDSTFEKYKKIAAIVVFVIFLLIFIWKRYKIVLFLTIISLITAVLYNLPNSTGIVKPDSFVYILPTKNSTIFFKVDKEEKVEVLQTKNGFIKVLGVDNGFIGWIKE